jgi:hypothetical protein
MDIGPDLAAPVARADLKAEADASAESSRKEYLMVTASVGTFKAPRPGHYTKTLVSTVSELIRKEKQEDLQAIRVNAGNSWSQGIAVGRYMEGKYTRKGRASGEWFPCKVLKKERGGWRVRWGDGDQHDTLKKTEHLRDIA